MEKQAAFREEERNFSGPGNAEDTGLWDPVLGWQGVGADSSRDAQVRKATMFLFWVFFFLTILEPGGVWVQLVLLLVAVFYLAAVCSAPLHRTLFRQKGSERDAA